jgi:hypothetical protein
MTFDDMRARLICGKHAPDVVKCMEVVNGRLLVECRSHPIRWSTSTR